MQEGGSNVESNRQLGLLIREAKTLGVRSEVVERNIKKASSGVATNYKELTYEAYGVGGVGFVINCLSDSNNRASAEVNACVKKLGDKLNPSFKMGSSGSVLFNFEKKGRLVLQDTIDEGKLIEVAIGADVDDVELQEPNEDKGDDLEVIKAVVLTAAESLGTLQIALQDTGIECAGSLENMPLSLIECSAEDMEKNLAALHKFEEIDDVDTVEHNMLLV